MAEVYIIGKVAFSLSLELSVLRSVGESQWVEQKNQVKFTISKVPSNCRLFFCTFSSYLQGLLLLLLLLLLYAVHEGRQNALLRRAHRQAPL